MNVDRLSARAQPSSRNRTAATPPSSRARRGRQKKEEEEVLLGAGQAGSRVDRLVEASRASSVRVSTSDWSPDARRAGGCCGA